MANVGALQGSVDLDYREFNEAIRQMNRRFRQMGDDQVRQANRTSRRIGAAYKAGIVAAVALVLKEVGEASLKASQQFDKLDRSFTAVFDGHAQQELDAIRTEADRLGLALYSTADAWKSFSAASQGTALEGQAAWKVFTSMTEASTALGLSSEQTEGALRAMEQMVSKGNVQAEELRGQLGERLPGAFKLAADAMGVTTKQLGKMLEQGQVAAEDLLPKLADALHNKYGAAAIEAANGITPALNRLTNQWEALKASLMDNDLAAAGINLVADALKRLTQIVGKTAVFFKGTWLGLEDMFLAVAEAAVQMRLAVEKNFGEMVRAIRASLMQAMMAVDTILRKVANALAEYSNPVAQQGAKTAAAMAGWVNEGVVSLFDQNMDSLLGVTKSRLTEMITELRDKRADLRTEMDGLLDVLLNGEAAQAPYTRSSGKGSTSPAATVSKAVQSQRKQLEAMLAQSRLDMATIGADPYTAERMQVMAEAAEMMRTMDDSMQPLIQSWQKQSLAVLEAEQAYEQNEAAMQKMADNISNIIQTMEQPLSDFLQTFAETGQLDFSGLAQSLIKSLQMYAAQMTARLSMEAIYQTILAQISKANYDYVAMAEHSIAASEALTGAAMMGSFVVGSGLAGMAHSGIDNIPSEGTWLLNKGERVVDSDTNKDLKSYLSNKGNSYDGPMIGTVQIQNSDEQGVLKALPALQRVIRDTISNDVASGGQVYKTIKNYT